MKKPKEESGRKRVVLVIVAAILGLTAVSATDAWEVEVRNYCRWDVKLTVVGDHLFWRQDDCTVSVKGGGTAVCVMPGGICPYELKGSVHTQRLPDGRWEDVDLAKMNCSGIQSVPGFCCKNFFVDFYNTDYYPGCVMAVKNQ